MFHALSTSFHGTEINHFPEVNLWDLDKDFKSEKKSTGSGLCSGLAPRGPDLKIGALGDGLLLATGLDSDDDFWAWASSCFESAPSELAAATLDFEPSAARATGSNPDSTGVTEEIFGPGQLGLSEIGGFLLE